MWTKRDRSNWKGSSNKPSRDRRDKEKNIIIYYECKKPRHYKFKCLDLDRTKGQEEPFQLERQ